MIDELLYTRADYLDDANRADAFERYYLPIVDEIGYRPDDALVDNCRRWLAEGDEHLNRMPLRYWDAIGAALMSYKGSAVRAAFKRRGDGVSLAGLVCVVKAACYRAATDPGDVEDHT